MKNYKRISEEELYILEDLDPDLANIVRMLQSGEWNFHIFKKYPQHFEVWWDPEKFNWKSDIRWLIQNMKHKFDIWWDPEKFNWDRFTCLILTEHLPDRFLDWWNPDYFDWFAASKLIKHCPQYVDIWIKDCPKEILSDPDIETHFIHSTIPPEKWICYLPSDSDLFQFLEKLKVEDLKKFKAKNLLENKKGEKC